MVLKVVMNYLNILSIRIVWTKWTKGLVSEAGDFSFDTQCLDGSKWGKKMDYTRSPSKGYLMVGKDYDININAININARHTDK